MIQAPRPKNTRITPGNVNSKSIRASPARNQISTGLKVIGFSFCKDARPAPDKGRTLKQMKIFNQNQASVAMEKINPPGWEG